MASGVDNSLFIWSPKHCCEDGPCNACLIKIIDDDDGYNLRSQSTTALNHVKAMYGWVKKNCDVDTQSICLERILMTASYKHKPDIVKYIIREEGAPVDFIPEKRYFYRIDEGWKEHEAFLDELEKVQYSPQGIMTPAMHAIYHDDIELLTWLIEQAGADIDFRMDTNGTAMSVAIENNKPTILKFLLDKGADPNKRMFCQGAALHIAIEEESIEMVQILLDCKRTDVNIMNDPKSEKEIDNQDDIPFSPLMDACSPNRSGVKVKPEIVELLLNHGADVNAVSGYSIDDGPQNALSNALYQTNFPCVELLLKHGADPAILGTEYCSGERSTFLERAASTHNIDIFKLALTYPEDITAEQRGQVLVNAAGTGNLDIFKLAMNLQDKNGLNTEHASNALFNTSSFEIMSELLELGADPNKLANKYRLDETHDTGNLIRVFEMYQPLEDEDSKVKKVKKLELLIQNGAIPGLFLDCLNKRIEEDIEDYDNNSNYSNLSDDMYHVLKMTIKDPAPYEYLAKCMSQADIPRFKELVEEYVKGLSNEDKILTICDNMADVCSLQHQCRSTIREQIMQVPQNFKQCLGELGLPTPLQDYLMFKE
ncbi:unnamed protein product [Owenia fusiformis]|uniref:SOCS box domain-containing protein n=1 Tax=Owenia fusiformis TaxID=6347 RepID=A0A8S4P844_OWEFU|nr:unnamed protein product [Owenia fusiformis]